MLRETWCSTLRYAAYTYLNLKCMPMPKGVYKWICNTGLCINKDKPQIQLFNTPLTPFAQPVIKIGVSVLTVSESYEYWGIILDSQMNLVKTISETVSTSAMMGQFRRNVSKSTANKYTDVRVHYNYYSVMQSEHKRLQMMQNRGPWA